MKLKSEQLILILGVLSIVIIIGLVITVNLDIDPELMSPVILGGLSILALLILGCVVTYKNKVLQPLKNITVAAKNLADGKAAEKSIMIQSDGMVGEVATQLNEVFSNVQSATVFAQEIGDGNFNSDTSGVNENDALTHALLDMRDKLKQVAEEEKKRNWAVQGLATFSELLRNNQDDLEALGYNVIKNLVKYLDANQGGFFSYKPHAGDAINEEDRLFKGKVELVACYAYERRKYKIKEVFVGEGLVGQCVVEQQTIYLNDVPNDYINITSGLGKSTPRSILIVPLKVNEEIFGVLEIASFKNIEEHQVKFVEDLSESIASTLSSVKMAMNTKKLLESAEESNQEMRRKEQQMEEIQEELAGKLKQNEEDTVRFQSVVEAINKTNASIEFDMKGNIIEANDMFCGVMGYTKSDLIGKSESFILPSDEKESPQNSMMWESLKAGQYFSGEFRRISKSGKDIWMNGTYNPIYDSSGTPYKIIKFASFSTDEKERELDLTAKLNSMRLSVGVLEIDLEQKVRAINALLLDDLGYRRLETRNKPLSLFTGKDYLKGNAWKSVWAGLMDGDAVNQTIALYKKEGGEKFYKANFSTIKNLKGVVIKVLCVLVDISKEVLAERKLQAELEQALNNSMIRVPAEDKESPGAMAILNDALDELNKGDLSVPALIKKNSLPLFVFNHKSMTIEDATLMVQALVGQEKPDLVGKKIVDIIQFTDKEKEENTLSQVASLNIFQEEFLIKAKDNTQKFTVLFAPILGETDDDAKVCMIVLSL